MKRRKREKCSGVTTVEVYYCERCSIVKSVVL